MITPLDSLKFMLVINELVEQSKEGFKPFSELKTYEEKIYIVINCFINGNFAFGVCTRAS